MLCRQAQSAARLASTALAPTRCMSATPIFSRDLTKRMAANLLVDIDLMVCDMAGTTVNEGGLVYKILRDAMLNDGLELSEADMHPWHGAKKEAVIEHFSRLAGTEEDKLGARIEAIGGKFLESIDEAYFEEASPVEHIDLTLVNYFRRLKQSGIKIGLDTGYPSNIQQGLIKSLKLESVVDAAVSSYDVAQGRPYPFMIFNLMERLSIMDVRRVAKVGDSVRDVEMGRNAGCGLVIGVLSGADSYQDLMDAGADVIVPNITEIPPPKKFSRPRRSSFIDLS